MKLTVKRIAKLKTPGRYREGTIPGLCLQITDTGVKSWLLRFERFGRERWHGLGPLHTVDLADARERARKARLLLLDGHDPIEARRAERAAAALEAAKQITFRQAAEKYDEQNNNRWKNRKAAAQFLSTLGDYAFPKIGALSVADVDTGQVLRVLEQQHAKYPNKRLWDAIPETASRLRGRMENVLDWATARGYRTGDNPARWKGHLANVLPPREQIARAENYEALPWAEVPQFLAALQRRDAIAARALEFTILTAARTGEVIGATWDEIDLDGEVWTVPPGRMKAGNEHRVPLSDRALEILRALPREEGNKHVFVGPAQGKGLSNMAMLTLLRRMGRDDITVHGFRSSFRDWAAERTTFPNFVAEMALAHVVKGVEGAYRRGDLLEKRRKLMDAWAGFCTTAPKAEGSNIVALRQAVG